MFADKIDVIRVKRSAHARQANPDDKLYYGDNLDILREYVADASVDLIYLFSGDIVDESELQYVMYYDAAGKAAYHGLERISGTLGGRKGSFVLHTEGKFDGQTAGGTWEVVAGSGTGELKGLSGTGSFTARLHKNETPYEINYRIETEG